ncbi:MAG: hypothetical protein HPY66_0894 [Firmicutes bacterium]|nr:hypothetical protein [Bacillota bacterium]MDI6705791.1 hypothetical protein [Bacillota bacterium]
MANKDDNRKKDDKEKEKRIRICELINREVPPAAYDMPYRPVCKAKNEK